MRGVVSAGDGAALERLGLTPRFDLVVGSSAGAINGAALLAGAARGGDRRVLWAARVAVVRQPAGVVRGKPVIDVNDVLDLVARIDAAGHERVTASSGDAALRLATDVDRPRG